MRQLILVLLIGVFVSANGQTVPPPYNGRPDIRDESKYIPPPYWTIWFTTTSCEDGYDYQSATRWVQSYDDSAEAFRYYRSLRSTGRVKVWKKMKCLVDTNSVYIDRYDMIKRKYDHD